MPMTDDLVYSLHLDIASEKYWMMVKTNIAKCKVKMNKLLRYQYQSNRKPSQINSCKVKSFNCLRNDAWSRPDVQCFKIKNGGT